MGRALTKPRSVAPHAVAFELAGERTSRLWLDASRCAAGLYLVGREATAPIEERGARALPGRDRHALLLLRKHLDGRRLTSLVRVRGERAVVLDFGGPKLALRVSGTPALTFFLDGAAVATIGEGKPWEAEDGGAAPESVAGAPLPPTDPVVWLPAPLAECHDRDFAGAAAVSLAGRQNGFAFRTPTWADAMALFLVARRRGARFETAQKAALSEARRELRRLARLEANLEQDLAGLPEAEALRRQGEALLAAPQLVPPGATAAELADPYASGASVRVTLDPRLSAPANADRLFAKARRIDRARAQVKERLRQTRDERGAARTLEARALEARERAELAPRATQEEEVGASGPRHYLTSRGLSMLVGRGARENHRLTFGIAKPEDHWLHARDSPGAHVIVRDPEGRAGAEDLREAAEVAAFFSDARAEARVDVHVTRRKHVRPARGGPGRVHVFHSETLRVVPRDPEGRLRRR